MHLTPRSKGSLIAGVACWLLFWFGVSRVDSIPYLNQYLSKKMIMDWIRKNPQLSLILTEAVNILLHGFGTASAMLFTLARGEKRAQTTVGRAWGRYFRRIFLAPPLLLGV